MSALSHWTRQWAVCACLAAGSACSQQTAVSPSPSPAGTPVAPTSTTFSTYSRTISGRVLNESGLPVQGATVVVFGESAIGGSILSPAAVTDGNGQYQAVTTALKPPFQYLGAEVTISAPGFEDTLGWAPGTGDTTQDFRLFVPVTMAVGSSVHLSIEPDSSICGSADEFKCRAIHVSEAGGRSVTLEAVPDDPAARVWLSVGGPANMPYPGFRQTVVTASPTGGDLTFQAFYLWPTVPVPFVIRATAN